MRERMSDRYGHELEVSPEEEALLRRAFHRFALPYMGAIAALGALAIVGVVSVRPAPDLVLPAAPDSEDVAALRGEAEKLRSQLTAMATRVEAIGREASLATKKANEAASGGAPSAGGVSPNLLSDVARRIDEAAQRMSAIEARIAATRSSGGATAAAGQDGERILAVEARQKRTEKALAALEKSLLDRVNGLEGSGGDRDADAVESAILERLDNLESRHLRLERQLQQEDTAPAP